MEISEELEKIMDFAVDEAMRTGNMAVLPEHLLLAVLRHGTNDAVKAMASCGADPARIKDAVERPVFRKEAVPYGRRDEIGFCSETGALLNGAVAESMKAGAERTSAIHLLLAMMRSPGNCRTVLDEAGVSCSAIAAFMEAAGLQAASECRTTLQDEIARALAEQLESRHFRTGTPDVFS